MILTYDPRVSAAMWLMADYLPEVAALDHAIFPHPERLAEWLGGEVADRARPDPARHAGLDARLVLGPPRARARSAMRAPRPPASRGWSPAIVERCVAAVAADLASGAWDERHGHLRALDAHDVGLRLVVARP